jgi:CMP/dCMP kinase
MIITIDGPVATGKSTVAKKLAEAIGYIFFDTGAMYRALTYGILEAGIDLNDSEQVEKFLRDFNLDIKIRHKERYYCVNGKDVTDQLRSEYVTSHVSKVSAIKAVRDKLVAIQRELAVGVNAVFEGRDMGTVVFPDAAFKVFLTGRPEVRAQRRYEEIVAKYPEQAQNLTLERCLEDLNKRDHFDSTRENSPLRQADDAYVVDTSDLSIDEVVFKILEHKDAAKTKRNPS